MKLVGIAGKAGSGKGTAARVLIEEFGFVEVNFADLLKGIVHQLWPLFTEDNLWGPSELRNIPEPAYGGLTPRRACQVIGTDIARSLDPDVWLRAWRTKVEEILRRGGAGVVASDMRFGNECALVHELGGKCWLIDRSGVGLTGDAGAHTSEAIPDVVWDAVIRNERSVEDFKLDVSLVASMCGFS